MSASQAQTMTVDQDQILKSALRDCEEQPRTYAVQPGQPRVVLTATTDNIRYLAEGLVDYWGARVGNFPGVDEVQSYLATLVVYRCDQINKRLEKGVSARDVPVPDFYFPFLAKIGRYEDELGTRVLLPTSCRSASEEQRNGARAHGAELGTVMDFNQVLSVGRRLKAAGVRVHYGLPVVLTASDSTLFRVRQDSQGLLFTGESILSTADVFVRSLVWYDYLEEEFGQANICYGSIHSFRHAFEALVALGTD